MTLDERITEIAADFANDIGPAYGTMEKRCDVIKSACYAAIRAFAEQEPSKAMILAVLPDNETEMGYLMALTCEKVYRAMMQAALKELK